MLTAKSFDARVTRDQGHMLCALSGTLTYDCYTRFRPLLDAVDSHADADVVLDLGDLDFVDSNGLCMLLTLKQRVHATGRTLRLVNVPPRVDKLLEHTRTRAMLGS
ncbi:MAG TPA: STAS domain-containing protein [Azospirillum sp.]|nr:STAS domain-containing protein [Azospirillum sp.]